MAQSKTTLPNHTISALILAAGKGTRMKSTLPKVLHPVLGRPMLTWIMDAVKRAGATDITIVLSPETKPFAALIDSQPGMRVAVQNTQRGTGDAVASAAKAYSTAVLPSWASGSLFKGSPSSAEWVLICAGDTPGISPQTIREFIAASMASGKKLAVLGMNVTDPKGYGRLIKSKDGGLAQIVEERDADAQTKKIRLCNSGVIFAEVSWLFELLAGLQPNNAQNEYYLTDIFLASASGGQSAFVFETDSEKEFAGVNDRYQLVAIEQTMLHRQLKDFMAHGVTFHMPDTSYVEADVLIEPDTRVLPGACLLGKTKVSRNCIIGPGAYIQDTTLGPGVRVGAHAVLIGCRVSEGREISPQTSYADLQL